MPWIRCLAAFALAADLFVMSGLALAADEGEALIDADAPAAAAAPAQPEPVPEIVKIKVKGGGSFGDIDMATHVFKPAGAAPYPVVVFLHGRAASAAARARLERAESSAQVRYWLAHGFAMVAPLRPGYGATGGPDAESSGVHWETGGTCKGRPAYGSTVAAGRKAVAATLDWLQSQPWADTRKVILVGQSVGGLLTVATGAERPPGVIGYINFAGGTGGNPEVAPGRSCDPQQLTELFAGFGKTTSLWNLWIYAQNDQYWGPEVPKQWHAAFAAGGSPTQFIQAPPLADGNGHGLSRHPQALWAPYLDGFLRSLGIQVA